MIVHKIGQLGNLKTKLFSGFLYLCNKTQDPGGEPYLPTFVGKYGQLLLSSTAISMALESSGEADIGESAR